MFGKTYFYAFSMYFIPLILISGQINSFLIFENSKKNSGSLLIYLRTAHTLFYFFSLRFVFFYDMCSIYKPLLLNAKSVVQCSFYFHLKGANDNKMVNKKRWNRKILLQI